MKRKDNKNYSKIGYFLRRWKICMTVPLNKVNLGTKLENVLALMIDSITQ